MRSSVGVVLLLVPYLLSAPQVRADNTEIRIAEDGPSIGVMEGKPVVVIDRGGGENAVLLWQSIGTVIQHDHTGLYLAYDPTGKTNAVFLKKNRIAGDGTEWEVKDATENLDRPRSCRRALTGPHKGWYLDYSDEVLRFGDHGKGHPLILSEKPGRIKKLECVDIDK